MLSERVSDYLIGSTCVRERVEVEGGGRHAFDVAALLLLLPNCWVSERASGIDTVEPVGIIQQMQRRCGCSTDKARPQ
jgi:hypothetical protein